MTTKRAITIRDASIIENRPAIIVKAINDRHKKQISNRYADLLIATSNPDR